MLESSLVGSSTANAKGQRPKSKVQGPKYPEKLVTTS
jgi:hypothetical protein